MQNPHVHFVDVLVHHGVGREVLLEVRMPFRHGLLALPHRPAGLITLLVRRDHLPARQLCVQRQGIPLRVADQRLDHQQLQEVDAGHRRHLQDAQEHLDVLFVSDLLDDFVAQLLLHRPEVLLLHLLQQHLRGRGVGHRDEVHLLEQAALLRAVERCRQQVQSLLRIRRVPPGRQLQWRLVAGPRGLRVRAVLQQARVCVEVRGLLDELRGHLRQGAYPSVRALVGQPDRGQQVKGRHAVSVRHRRAGAVVQQPQSGFRLAHEQRGHERRVR
mmetsp:Transcript_168797/g.542506  ORF Transcript_168797/g.542506 Transcript_168797/m.542506 type:complete len:272 (-) Transcript_168797:682-1497(-)